MYVIVKKSGSVTKTVSGVIEDLEKANSLLQIYRSKVEPNGVTFYIRKREVVDNEENGEID